MGDPADFGNFMGAVIDAGAFRTQKEAIAEAQGNGATVLVGGGTDDSEGFFVQPTVIETSDPDFRLLRDELFGPIVTAYVYPEREWEQTLELVDNGAPYGLTGAIFAQERAAIDEAGEKLRYAAGNFYVNDKPTGAVVGQQPFGGVPAAGTNGQAGAGGEPIPWGRPRARQGSFRSPAPQPAP